MGGHVNGIRYINVCNAFSHFCALSAAQLFNDRMLRLFSPQFVVANTACDRNSDIPQWDAQISFKSPQKLRKSSEIILSTEQCSFEWMDPYFIAISLENRTFFFWCWLTSQFCALIVLRNTNALNTQIIGRVWRFDVFEMVLSRIQIESEDHFFLPHKLSNWSVFTVFINIFSLCLQNGWGTANFEENTYFGHVWSNEALRDFTESTALTLLNVMRNFLFDPTKNWFSDELLPLEFIWGLSSSERERNLQSFASLGILGLISGRTFKERSQNTKFCRFLFPPFLICILHFASATWKPQQELRMHAR